MLPQMERDKLVAEWCRLVGREDKPRQLDEVSRGGRGNKDGNAEAARQLGLSEPDVRRAAKVASITPEAQQAAHEVGLASTSAQRPFNDRERGVVGNRWATKSKQLQASASRWVQLVGIWWTSSFPARQNCFTEKYRSTLFAFRNTIIFCAQGHFVKR